MIRGAITSNMDVAQVVLYAFFVFFAGLVFYLRREDRREGYPLESEVTGQRDDRGFLLIPTPKYFHRANGSIVAAPNFEVDPRPVNGAPVARWAGAPLEPVGDPLLAGVGPGAYAMRADKPEQTYDGHNLLAPFRVASNFAVASEDGDPIGLGVVGADRVVAGVVKDLWVDRSEGVLRYYEVELSDGRGVLLPVTFAKVDFQTKTIKVQALFGSQFTNVPALRNPDEITLLEEEKVTAYYGAGTLYATPARMESLL